MTTFGDLIDDVENVVYNLGTQRGTTAEYPPQNTAGTFTPGNNRMITLVGIA